MYGGQASFIPLSVNTAGVIPIIFAQSIIMFPGTIAAFFQNVTFLQTITLWLSPGHMVYIVLYSLIIIFFTYFYTAIVLNPVDLADNMKKYGGFIPGIRPGKRTAEYIDRILTRITLPGAIFLAFIAVLPDILIRQANVPFYFGGTGLLDRGGRNARHPAADGVAPADAPLRRIREARPLAGAQGIDESGFVWSPRIRQGNAGRAAPGRYEASTFVHG